MRKGTIETKGRIREQANHPIHKVAGKLCPVCKAPLVASEGCWVCMLCGHTEEVK